MSVCSNRNVLYSRLLMKEASSKNSEFCKQVLVARHGLPACDQEEATVSAELWVFKESHNPANTSSQPPTFTIPLQGAKLERILLSENSGGSVGDSSVSGGDAGKVANNSSSSGDGDDGEAAASSCSGGSKKEVGSEVRRLPGAPGNSLLGLTTAGGRSYHFCIFDEEEHKAWTNLLKFLTVFPHSTLPVWSSYDLTEPCDDFDPVLYNADSVWPVYISPDEIGLRCGIQGPRVLTLQNQKPGLPMSKLEIYSTTDHQVPILSCKHNEIKRIGKMGLFLYVELGRRSKCGAGLLWMYFGKSTEQASSMRDLMCKFLLQQKSTLTPQLRRAHTAPILISTLASPQLQNRVKIHRSSLASPPPLPPRRYLPHIHYSSSLPHLTIATPREEDAATTPTSSTPGSEQTTFQGQNIKHFFVSEAPQAGTDQDQEYGRHRIAEQCRESGSESECSNHYHVLEPHGEPDSESEHSNHYHAVELHPKTYSDPKQNYYHVLETLQENVSDPNSQHYHVLEPENESCSNPRQPLYHTLEPNAATGDSKELHHYDTVDLKRMRRHSEQNHRQQYLPGTNTTPRRRQSSVDTGHHRTIGTHQN